MNGDPGVVTYDLSPTGKIVVDAFTKAAKTRPWFGVSLLTYDFMVPTVDLFSFKKNPVLVLKGARTQ